MFEVVEGPHRIPQRDWRWILSVVWAAAAGPAAAQAVGEALEPALGAWGAFAIAVGTAVIAIAVVARAASWIVARDWRPVLAVAWPVGLGFGTAEQLREQVGFWGSALTAGLVAALVVTALTWVTRRQGDGTGAR